MFRRVLRYFLILTAVVLLTMAFLLAMERPWTPRSAPAEAPPRSAAVTTAVTTAVAARRLGDRTQRAAAGRLAGQGVISR
jgi:putative Ca2+/H+ antiporter (TMEM165/GDT1 family)